MQQQLLQGTVNIVPETMNQIISQLTRILSSSTLDDHTLQQMIKALFYGLWNFDKMINQHNLSTAISLMPLSIPKQNKKMESNFIKNSYHIQNKQIHAVGQIFDQGIIHLLQNVQNQKFKRLNTQKIRSGLLYHVTDIYFQIVTNFCLDNNEQFDFKKLDLFQWHHVIDKIYANYKNFLIQSFKDEQTQLQQQLKKVIDHFLQTAKNQQQDIHRKNIYDLVGYFKSEHLDYSIYEKEKREKAALQKLKIKKKLTKHKVKLIKQEKLKRKQKKNNKNKKIISKRKIQFNKGRGNKKVIEDF